MRRIGNRALKVLKNLGKLGNIYFVTNRRKEKFVIYILHSKYKLKQY